MESRIKREELFVKVVDLIGFVELFRELFGNEICDELLSYIL
jgi:hypothetical protein